MLTALLSLALLADQAPAQRGPRLAALERDKAAASEPERLDAPLILGELLYRTPAALGPRAVALGLSCETCHPGGGASATVSVEGASDRPGNVDLHSPALSPEGDDGVWAPRNIPALRGARYTSPYARDGGRATLEEMLRAHALGFGRTMPPAWVHALANYVRELEFQPNARLDALGRLTDRADAAAHRGEALFRAPRPGLGGASCATCHAPASFFTDRKPHGLHHAPGTTVQQGEGFDTPSLLGLASTAPYFFDGSAPDLPAAVKQLDATSGLGLSAEEQADLVAYLAAVGAEDGAPAPLDRRAWTRAQLGLLLEGPYASDAALWPLVLAQARAVVEGPLRAELDARLAKPEPPGPADRALVQRLVDALSAKAAR